jgi:hypothetical protein
MRIDELDEYQGLTAEMVRNYLAATGWHLKDWDYYKDWHLAECAGPPCIAIYDSSHDGMYNLNPEHALLAISKHERRTSQAILREINPRWRKGWPSGEALAMHDRWIVSKPEGVVIMCRWRPPYMVNAAGGGDLALREQCEHWSFWPCDEHGNKVRWPVDAEGKML